MAIELGMLYDDKQIYSSTNTLYLEERQQDMCPICKTDRYLSPDMKFLVNPECYHKMCESCVDRIYALGPAPCPYPGCGKTLRKAKFKAQIFDDIDVEREVDIRKRVSQIFNKSGDDFTELDKYNAYLEEVETIIFNLVNKIDIEETEAKLSVYEEHNKSKILENNNNREKEYEDFKKQEELDKELRLKKIMLEKQIEQEEKEMNEQAKREILNKLSTSQDPNQMINQIKSSTLKRSSARRKQLNEIIKSLNSKGNPQEQQESNTVPFTPFNGDRVLVKNFNPSEEYYDPFIDELQKKKDYIAAGFKAEQVYDRVLSEAFMGLGCFIEQEKSSIVEV
ncbi:RNA polymerase II transcription factor B subunit 3 [Wickerhamomyces ciferrii]|uniref:RNA polymerase II transcription factor B subunit 3 n=1 Tax=Wickerhamomyces ciferrii (strain ATCC 14091 / BCRC 22168 / CBS 111 / JCM 3599 / NBRC 0793 / NRRL Y-1031 F-60-10) TaxID=1206466 RepID=K0KMS7_WICCF|nr:RNA polymerase II transcription factor B subunit 3 [Wickerhamomyces ciferrii]CCH42423.1 RNA polymerase II transcription factor B subunit 3 [Wickerhamomyces ciferrii]